jgi:hypothetical protein
MAPEVFSQSVSQTRQLEVAQQLPTVAEVGIEKAIAEIARFYRSTAESALIYMGVGCARSL